MEKCCETCKYFWEDHSVGASECENEIINEDELDKYYGDGEDGCPHWVARYTEEEIAAEEAYIQKMMEQQEWEQRMYEEQMHEERMKEEAYFRRLEQEEQK